MTILRSCSALENPDTDGCGHRGAYGKATLSREQMLYACSTTPPHKRSAVCWCELASATWATRTHRRSSIAKRIALRVAQRSLRRGIFRCAIACALGVGAFAYADTGTVADAAIEVFSRDMVIEGEAEVEGVRVAQAAQRKPRAPAKKAAATKRVAKSARTSRAATRN